MQSTNGNDRHEPSRPTDHEGLHVEWVSIERVFTETPPYFSVTMFSRLEAMKEIPTSQNSQRDSSSRKGRYAATAVCMSASDPRKERRRPSSS